MKYVATINGKRYEVEVEKVDAYKSLDRNGVAAPKAPVLAASAPRAAAPHLHQQHRLLQQRQLRQQQQAELQWKLRCQERFFP